MYSLFPAHIDGISAEFTIAGHLLRLDLPTMLSEEGIFAGGQTCLWPCFMTTYPYPELSSMA